MFLINDNKEPYCVMPHLLKNTTEKNESVELVICVCSYMKIIFS